MYVSLQVEDEDVLVPECFNRTFILGGWSQNIPACAAKMSKIFI